VKRTFLSLLLLFLPLSALADGIVIPTIAFPAQVTIPDQRALICFTNGTERLVIETRFNGEGTNFAWVVPLPGRPVIEEATTGLFPTLQFIFRPKIVHEVSRYYIGILIAVGFVYLFRLAAKSVSNAFTIAALFLLLLFLAAMLLPTLSKGRSAGINPVSLQEVSILDRKLVGIFETTTITSHDAKALQTWLAENGFALPTNSEPIIESYVKDGWVFVATKVRRDHANLETTTPHPLSFTFKTDKPVYPMRLTGLNSDQLKVDLYIFGSARATASHFKVESCTRPNISHPLLQQWTAGSTVVTKLTATLSRANMRNDVWINWTPFFEKENRLFSRHGASVYALNLGMVVFTAGLLGVNFFIFTFDFPKTKLPRWIGNVIVTSIVLGGLLYLSLSKIEVKLVKGFFYSYGYGQQEQLALQIALGDFDWHTTIEARTGLQALISNPTNGIPYGIKNWDNYFIGGQIHEEDSPGNYLLRETNNQLQLITFNHGGGEEISGNWDLHAQH
jgi:hypothetical protein